MDSRATFDALHSFASVARELAEQDGMASTGQRVVDLAAKVVGCDAAILTRRAGLRLKFDAGTDSELTAVLAQVSATAPGSITMQASLTGRTVVCQDLNLDPNWIELAERVVPATGIRSVLAFHLQLDEVDLGALTFYSQVADYFTVQLRELASVYADHAAIALSLSREQEKVHNLNAALASNRHIGAAVGIVMHSLTLDEDAAFDMLRVASQHSNRKLADLADDVVSSSSIDPVTAIARERVVRDAAHVARKSAGPGHRP